MNYNELKELIKNKIANGEKLHGWMLDIAMEMSMEDGKND